MTKKMLKDLSASSIPLARFQRGSHTAEAERPNITMHTALFIGLAMPYHAHSTAGKVQKGFLLLCMLCVWDEVCMMLCVWYGFI